MRLNGHRTLTLEDARTWIEETGLCLFLPRRQFSLSVAPSFVEAVAGQRNPVPDARHIAIAEDLLVRLERDGIAVRLNLLGQPSEQPDFVVAGWVLPYVYALRGDRDWRRSPQLTGSRQVSQLAIQAYKQLEQGEATIAALKHALGREVSEAAVLRAITELWQQLRIIPVVAAPGQPAKWQLLRVRFQKAIAEGASTSQVTAISVLASIYLQAVIAASMEDVELFLAPLTARSKIREVLRGLVATRQVHTIPLGHAPHFYVAGTLPEFATAPTVYASAQMPASAYFMSEYEPEEEVRATAAQAAPAPAAESPRKAAAHTPRKPARSESTKGRPHFSRTAAHSRDRKPAAAKSRPSRHSAAEPRSTGGARWTGSAGKSSNGNHRMNGSRNGGHGANGAGAGRTAVGRNGMGSAKASGATWSKRNGHAGGKATGKATLGGRNGSAMRKEAPRPARGRGKTLAASAKAGNNKSYGFTARAKQGAKKRG